MQFKPYEKNIQEVNGQTIKSVIIGFKSFRTLAAKFLLNENIGIIGDDGFILIKDDDWYPQEAWLKTFEKIAIELGRIITYIRLEEALEVLFFFMGKRCSLSYKINRCCISLKS